MKMMKRGLSLLLALVLVAGYMSVRAEAAAKVKPEARSAIIYNGTAQALLTQGSAEDGYSWHYMCYTINGEPMFVLPDDGKQTEVGVYTARAFYVKDEEYDAKDNDISQILELSALLREGEEVNRTVRIYPAMQTAPTGKADLVYNGKPQDLLATKGSIVDCVDVEQSGVGSWRYDVRYTEEQVLYSVTAGDATAPGTFTSSAMATDPGTYRVWYTASAKVQYKDEDRWTYTLTAPGDISRSFTVTIGECSHTGGTATCASGKICTKCETAYTEPLSHNYTYSVPESKDSIIESCDQGCRHNATLTLVENSEVSKVYNGSPIEGLKVQAEGWKGTVPDITYTPDNTNAGTVTGTVTVDGNQISKTFDIEKAAMDDENVVSAEGCEVTYDGTPHKITVTAPQGAKITYATEIDGTYTEEHPVFKDVGEYAIYYKVEPSAETVSENYTGTVAGQATIKINSKEVTVVAGIAIGDYSKFGDNAKIEYGDAVPTYIYKYDGLASGELANEVITGGTMVTCDYKQGDAAGEYVLEVDISALSAKNYTFKTENGKLVVEPRELEIEWGETEFTYDGESHVPAATVKNAVGEDEITLSITGAKTSANTESAPKYTATIEGFAVEGGDENNYKLPETKTKEFEIKAAAQEAPAELEAEKETILNKGDGKITGVTTAMEYRKEGETAYTAVSGTTISNLTSGKYFVRYKAKTNYAASPDTEMTVEAEASLMVTVPATQEGYTLTADKTAYGYNDNPVLTLTVAEGYTMTANFVMTVTIGEDEIEVKEADLTYDSTAKKYTYTITDLQKDAAVTVEGIEDVTNPAIKLTMESDLKDPVEFTDMMDKPDVEFEEWWGIGTTITPVDTTGEGSDVTFYYLESDEAMTQAQLNLIEDEEWETCTGSIRPSSDGNKIFYFKAVDKGGNSSDYVSTKGFIYDGTAPVLSLGAGTKTFGITRRVTVSDKNLESVEINDVAQDVKERTAITYRMTRDTDDDKAKTYTIVIADKAGNETEGVYTIEPMKFVEKGTSWSKGSKKTLDFKVNTILGDYVDVSDYDMKFQVKIDSKVIDAKNYTVEEAADGSGTFIKLKPDYLKGLKAAKHKIQVSVIANKASGTGTETLDSTETVEFNVSDNPATGDSMNMALWGGMAVLSLMAAAVLVLGKKRFDA